MAMTGRRVLRHLALAGVILALGACGSGQKSALTELTGELAASVTKGSAEATNITATRASLTEAGFKDPLIVMGLPNEGTRGGLLKTRTKGGVTFWTAADGLSTVMLEAGVLRGTTALGHDLYTVDTKAARAAISSGKSSFYTRMYRHPDGKGDLIISEYACRMDPEAHETIEVFDRSHATVRFEEICVAQSANGAGVKPQLTNTYWRDKTAQTIWRARQWVSPKLGYMTLERVFE